ncbi:hypothetical protein [Pseudonocardia parietis]|uniref:Outer membrane murein-binding lipoprotein Lpp n=1 Tax=Pseudonocardia parietis TaxID=570936 RepID=A0ABS4W3A9_9PSEU|nr:hypothetical protein [Pseudonocardia parietis]MBP2370608.1 outer membrane murein-binding lipoprotein Lpp [Pseudonocardia parietis]
MGTRTRTGASVRAATVVVAALLVLSGCSSGPATLDRAPDDSGPGTSSSDRVGEPGAESLRTKFRYFSADGRLTRDPAEVFGRCARFTGEIRNVLPQIRRDVPAAADQADATEQALDRFATAGCEAAPGMPGGGDAATCGPAYREVQEATQGLATAVGASR